MHSSAHRGGRIDPGERHAPEPAHAVGGARTGLDPWTHVRDRQKRRRRSPNRLPIAARTPAAVRGAPRIAGVACAETKTRAWCSRRDAGSSGALTGRLANRVVRGDAWTSPYLSSASAGHPRTRAPDSKEGSTDRFGRPLWSSEAREERRGETRGDRPRSPMGRATGSRGRVGMPRRGRRTSARRAHESARGHRRAKRLSTTGAASRGNCRDRPRTRRRTASSRTSLPGPCRCV